MENAVKVEEQKVKKTDELTKAVVALTARFKREEELANKRGLVGGSQRLGNTLRGAAKDKINDMFSAKGAAGMLGFKQGGMIMNLLGARHDLMKEAKIAKAEEASKAKAHAENYMKYNVEGQELAKKDPKIALEAGVQNYKEVLAKQKEIDALKKELEIAEKTGHGEIAKERHGGTIEELERQRRSITSGKNESMFTAPKGGFKAKPQTTPEEAPGFKGNTDIIESLIALGYSKQEANSAASALPPDIGVSDGIKAAMKALSKQPDTTVSKGGSSATVVASGGSSSPAEELIDLNKQQLDALNKLVSSETETAEDKLEEKSKNRPGMPMTSKTETKDKESKGIFNGLMSSLTGILGSVLSPGKMLGNLAKGAGGLGLKALKGVGGLGLSALKGFGSLASSGVGKLIGTGAEVGEKVVGKELAKSGAKGLGKSILKKIPGIGLLAGIGFAASRMMDGDYVGAGLELASGAASTIPGLGTAASVGIDAGLAARDMGAFEGDEAAKVLESPEMARPATTSRETQIAELNQAQKRAERIEREKADTKTSNVSAPIVNNTSVNNSTTVTKIQAPVRNFEPSFNRRLDYAFITAGVRG